MNASVRLDDSELGKRTARDLLIAQRPLAQRATEAGFARHLAKPASLQMMEEVIASLHS